MFRVALKLALAAAAVWAVFTYVPIRGRTLAARWDDAPTASAFVERGLAELGVGKAAARPDGRAQRGVARERPTEGHTEADRRAIDRLLSEQLAGRR